MSVWTGIGVFNVIASQSMKLFFSLRDLNLLFRNHSHL